MCSFLQEMCNANCLIVFCNANEKGLVKRRSTWRVFLQAQSKSSVETFNFKNDSKSLKSFSSLRRRVPMTKTFASSKQGNANNSAANSSNNLFNILYEKILKEVGWFKHQILRRYFAHQLNGAKFQLNEISIRLNARLSGKLESYSKCHMLRTSFKLPVVPVFA